MEKNQFFVYFSLFTGMTLNGIFSCTEGLDPIGWIVPYEDRFIHVGESFNMTCILSSTQTVFPNATSADLQFFVNDEPVSNDKLNILNETSLEFYEKNSTLTDNNMYDLVSCKLYDKLLCTKHVTVGYEPLQVTNFSCISNNWENLTCTWHEMPNPISTTYSLCYVALIRTPNSCRPCPVNYSSPGSCTWPTGNYDKLPRLNFTMTIYNKLGNKTQTFPTVNHYAIMLPKQMENLSISNVTKNSAQVSWWIPAMLQNFPAGLSFKVSFKPEANWSKVNETILEGSELNILNGNSDPPEKIAFLTDLPYANVPYEVKVCARSNQSENLWSEPSIVTLTTLPDIPCSEPAITNGSFWLENTLLVVYWAPVPPHCENGDDFHYHVTLSQKGNGAKANSSDTSNSYAQFNHTDLANEYEVSITSVNHVGNSSMDAKLMIPSESNILSKPLEIVGIFYPADRLLEVTWSPSFNSTESKDSSLNYTIFWCHRGTDNYCSGKLEWVEVAENTTTYNITSLADDFINDHLVFVAATRGQYSSGMEKACLIKDTRTIDTVQGLTISNENSTGWKMRWIPIDCGKRKGIIENYRIYISSEGQSYNKTITLDNTVYNYEINDAFPAKNYTVQMSVLSRYGEGDLSNAFTKTKSDDSYTWLAVGITFAAVILCTVAAVAGYRHCTILQKTKGMKAVLPWSSQSMVTTLVTEKQGNSRLPSSYQPTIVPYDRSTKSPVTSTFSLSDRGSLSSETSENFPSKNEGDISWSPITGQSNPVFESLEQEDDPFKEGEQKDTLKDPRPHTKPLQQPYVMLGNPPASKHQPGYVTLGQQQQEKPVEFNKNETETTTTATGYVTLGKQDHPETEIVPTVESTTKQSLPGYVLLGQLTLQ